MKERDIPDNRPVFTTDEQYFLAAIETPYHQGEAVIKFDGAKNFWRCLFTLRDRIVAAIHSVPIEKKSIVQIIRVQRIEAFDEFASSNIHNNNTAS